MARYHLFKGTRGYDNHAYCGPSSLGIPAEADTIKEAEKLRDQLNSRNPGVGWGIYDTNLKKYAPYKI